MLIKCVWVFVSNLLAPWGIKYGVDVNCGCNTVTSLKQFTEKSPLRLEYVDLTKAKGDPTVYQFTIYLKQ